MQALLDQIGAMPALIVMLLVTAAMFVDASPVAGLLVPGDMLLVTVVASSHPIPPALTVVVIVAAAVAGTLASWTLFFFVGRRVGPRLRHSQAGRWIGGGRWDTAERLLAGPAARALTLVQFLPVLNAVMPTVAGVLGMRYRHFVRFAAPGALLWAVFFAVVGVWVGPATAAVFGESGSPLRLLVFAAPGVLAGYLMLVYLRRQLATYRASTSASNELPEQPAVLWPAELLTAPHHA
ncbi:MAG TPA: VTT domain-containing protein [Pseudonocardiaceae bacterium]